MVAVRLLVLMAVCGALFASPAVRANDTPPPETEKLAVISFPGINADEMVGLVKKVGYTKIVRLPLVNAVLVCGSEEEIADLRRLLRPL